MVQECSTNKTSVQPARPAMDLAYVAILAVRAALDLFVEEPAFPWEADDVVDPAAVLAGGATTSNIFSPRPRGSSRRSSTTTTRKKFMNKEPGRRPVLTEKNLVRKN